MSNAPSPSLDALRRALTQLRQELTSQKVDAGRSGFVQDDMGHDDMGHDDMGHNDMGHNDMGHNDMGHNDMGHDDVAGASDRLSWAIDQIEQIVASRDAEIIK